MHKMTLTKEEVAIAGEMGSTLTEFARQKRRRELEQIEYEKWLQTPAGIKHMEAKLKKREEELKKQRQRAKAYRARKKAEG